MTFFLSRTEWQWYDIFLPSFSIKCSQARFGFTTSVHRRIGRLIACPISACSYGTDGVTPLIISTVWPSVM
jgi:hypothetical protein